jgi:hypothetical protein
MMPVTYNSQILSIVTFVYGLAGVLYLFAWIFRREAAAKVASWVAVAAWLGNTAGILLRWYESYQLPGGMVMHLSLIYMNPWPFSPGPSPSLI